MDPTTFMLHVAGFLVWAFVAWQAYRHHADLVLMALVLIVLGLLGSDLLDAIGVLHSGAWAFLATGVLMLAAMRVRR